MEAGDGDLCRSGQRTRNVLLVQEGTRTGHRSLEETPIDVMGLRLTSSEKATVLCVWGGCFMADGGVGG